MFSSLQAGNLRRRLLLLFRTHDFWTVQDLAKITAPRNLSNCNIEEKGKRTTLDSVLNMPDYIGVA